VAAISSKQWWGRHGERGARVYTYTGGLGQSPQRGLGPEPLVRESRGEALLKLKEN